MVQIVIKRGHSGDDSAERDLTRWRWVITPKCYVCSCYGISSVESQRFWVYVISRYPREVGSLTSTSLVHGLDSCEQTWEFVVFNMDFRMRGRVLRTLYFHRGSNVFIVTSDARRLAQTSNYRRCVSSCKILSVFVIKLWPSLPFHSPVTFFLHLLDYESCINTKNTSCITQ